jgi:hypothetical protein
VGISRILLINKLTSTKEFKMSQKKDRPANKNQVQQRTISVDQIISEAMLTVNSVISNLCQLIKAQNAEIQRLQQIAKQNEPKIEK